MRSTILVAPHTASLLGLSLPQEQPERFRGLLVLDNHAQHMDSTHTACNAPFADQGHRAALPALAFWPKDAEVQRAASTAHAFWQHRWAGRSLLFNSQPLPTTQSPNPAAPLLPRNTEYRQTPVLPPGERPPAFAPTPGEYIAHAAVEYFSP